MPLPRPSHKPALMLLALALLLTACESAPRYTPPLPVRPAQVPPLPALAKQPAPPPICSPTCSAGLQTELESWLTMPTGPALPARPASAPTRP